MNLLIRKNFNFVINVFKPTISLTNIYFVLRALLRNEISGSSKEVKKFENNLMLQFDRKYCVAVTNGSAALDVALQLLKLKKGDEVIVPAFTIISCLSAITRSGATPVFCDVNLDTWNMQLSDIKKVYSKNTKAVLMVHTYGLTAQALEIEQFCKKNNLYLVEDAAEAHGQTVNGRKCGTFGDISTLSFYANKHITSGEGGALMFDDEALQSKARKMINLDFDNTQRFVHKNLYWNHRLSDIQAALGNSQIRQIDNTIRLKKIQGKEYIKLFDKYNLNLQTPLISTDLSENHFWVFGIVLGNDYDRDELLKKLYNLNIETRPFFWPLNEQPAISNLIDTPNTTPNSAKIGKQGFYIPMGRHINKKTQKRIVLAIKDCLEQ